LRPGDRLPPTRELATQLEVSRGTVATAYERLVAEGFLTARVGAGTYVTDMVPATGARGRRRTGAVRPRRGWTALPAPVTTSEEVPYDFSVGVPDPQLFPLDTWRRLVAAEMRVRANSPGRYADPAGHPGLREAVSRYVGVSRSVLCDAEDVVVTTARNMPSTWSAESCSSPATPSRSRTPDTRPPQRFSASRVCEWHPSRSTRKASLSRIEAGPAIPAAMAGGEITPVPSTAADGQRGTLHDGHPGGLLRCHASTVGRIGWALCAKGRALE
jgi:Bacterial regulatory proteins, gntR family